MFLTARSIRTRTPCGRVLTPSKASRARGTQQLRPCGKLAGTDRATRRSGSSNAIGTQPLRPCGKPKGTACVGQTAASGRRDCLLQVQGTGPLCPNMHRSPSGARKAAQYGKRQSPSVSPSSPTAATALGGVPDPLIPMACRANCPYAPAPFLALTIAGRKFAALSDSGASATLFGDDVLAHLHRRAIRLRACDITFHLASGKATSGCSARLVVRWEK